MYCPLEYSVALRSTRCCGASCASWYLPNTTRGVPSASTWNISNEMSQMRSHNEIFRELYMHSLVVAERRTQFIPFSLSAISVAIIVTLYYY
jgi:hypothetical protein